MQPTKLLLLIPQGLLPSYALSQPNKIPLTKVLDWLENLLLFDSDIQSKKIIIQLQQLEPLAILPLSDDLLESTHLTPQKIKEFDQYMQISHVKSHTPEKLIVKSLMIAYHGFAYISRHCNVGVQDLRLVKLGFQECISLLRNCLNLGHARSNNRNANIDIFPNKTKSFDKFSKAKPINIWRNGHWVFSIFTQALILTLQRFVVSVNISDYRAAKKELSTATNLLWASGAAMKITGNFTRQQYESEVRFTMASKHPQSLVQSTSLSGLLMWDHDYLVNVIWRVTLSPIVKNIPNALQSDYQTFVRAYQEGLSHGHKTICGKFGGNELESLIASPGNTALANLEKFETNRLKMIDPNKLFRK